jgi:branched-chain amino acid transport system permease protein
MSIIAVLPLILGGLWVGLVGEGLAFAIAFLSYTLVTGEGGMIWLCQITFAGLGAVVTAHLATTDHWPVLLAVLAGGLAIIPVGVIIGLLTIRIGELYIALVTLTFGVLVDNLIFTLNVFTQFGQGVTVNRPSLVMGDRAFTYLVLAVFCVLSIFIVNLRRSTPGLALAAVRWSEPAARTMGLSVVQMKVLVTGLAAFVAGIAGGLLSIYTQSAIPTSYATLGGLVWLAILVTIGVRSNVAAAFAGVSFTIFPAIFINYIPLALVQIPTALFGFGAIMVARHPDGIATMHARQVEFLVARLLRRGSGAVRTPSDPAPGPPLETPEPAGAGVALETGMPR